MANNSTITKNLKIIYWNCRSFCPKKIELEPIYKFYDILVFTESWLKEKDYVELPGYLTFRKDRSHSRGGGILIFIRQNISYQVIDNIISPCDSVELCGISLTNITPPFSLYVCYRSPGKTLTQNQWDVIFSNINTNNNALLLGDFNAHNKLWNCNNTDLNGTYLANSIDSVNMLLLNHNSITHYNAAFNTYSNIDLIISSATLAEKIIFKTHEDSWSSDHFPIFLEMNVERSMYSKKTFKIKTKKTNWEMISEKLSENFTEICTSNYESLPPTEKYKFLTLKITEALKQASSNVNKKNNSNVHSLKNGNNNYKKKHNPVSWWDCECEKVIRLRKAAFKKWQFTGDYNDYIEFKKRRAIVKRTLKIKKKESFKNFAETIDFRVDPTYVWNWCKILKNKWTKITPKHSESNDSRLSMITEALEKLTPPMSSNLTSAPLPPCSENNFLSHPFDFKEFNIALENKKNKSAPGLDGIDFQTLKNMPTNFKLLMLDCFNEMYKTKMYPESWKKSYLHFIPKSDGKSVRPIALTSCICKTFETMVKNRLQWWLEHCELLPPTQNGFRAGRSCLDGITQLTLKVEEAFAEKKQVIAVFLDVKGAFDNILSNSICEELANLGCPLNLVHFVHFLINERQIYSEINPDDPRMIYKGVPQGGVLSPTLYAIVVKGITHKINRLIKISQYADDIVLYLKCRNHKWALKTLEKAIKTIAENLAKVGLQLAPHKTVMLHFNRKNYLPGQSQIKIHNHIINSSPTAKFLGVIFYYRLSFKAHADHIFAKCRKALNVIKFLCGIKWGSDPQTLLSLYKSLIRSLIDYSSFIYLTNKKYSTEKIEKIQQQAIRIALGHRQTTPLNVLIAESSLTLVKDRASQLGNNFIGKIFSFKNSLTLESVKCFRSVFEKSDLPPCRPIHYSITRLSQCSSLIHSMNNIPIYTAEFDTITSSIEYDSTLGQSLSEIPDANTEFEKHISKQQTLNIFTDGSKTNTNTGCACICPDVNFSKLHRLPNQASIFTAECLAILDALDFSLKHTDKNCCIFTDSLSTLKALNSLKLHSKTNHCLLQIKRKFQLFHQHSTNNSKLKFFWIPAHKNIQGNELADIAAKRAAQASVIDILQIPSSDLFPIFKKEAIESTILYLTDPNNTTGKRYFKYLYTKQLKPWFHITKLKRETIVTINRIRADHYNLAASLHRVKIITDPKCKCGSDSEDIDHVVWQCSLYETQRLKLWKRLKKLKLQAPLSTQAVFSEPFLPAATLICAFLKECNIVV